MPVDVMDHYLDEPSALPKYMPGNQAGWNPD